MISNSHCYQVDGEVGRLRFETHRVQQQGQTITNTAQDLFARLRGQEWYQRWGFKEIGLMYGTREKSYRKAAGQVNRIRHQPGATPVRTLREASEGEGQSVQQCPEQTASGILGRHQFSPDGRPLDQMKRGSIREPNRLPEQQVSQAMAACGVSGEDWAEVQGNPVGHEDAAERVNISLDDVGAKKQKARRQGGSRPAAEGKRVYTSVAHLEHKESQYIITGGSLVAVLRLVIAFVLHNDLLRYGLQFFVDGQRTLQAAILKALCWHRWVGLILDWYHPEKKCEMQLSLGLRGRAIRHQVLEQLSPLLWYGWCDRAIAYLQQIAPTAIKDPAAIDKLIGYIERHRPYIPCYAVRQQLGLRNSSNRGEKANHQVGADRQKHQGMSWSPSGSVALVALAALKLNREDNTWLENGVIAFNLAA